MSTKIAFPNNRLAQPALGNPLFVSDVSNNTENLIQAMGILLGLDLTSGFAILQGMAYTGSAYGAGYVFMGNGSVSGNIYYTAGIAENKYLNPTQTDIDLKIHSDGNNYNTYRVYQAISSDTQIGGFPQFVGNMNAYRLSINTINTTINLGLTFSATGFTIFNYSFRIGKIVTSSWVMACTSGHEATETILTGSFSGLGTITGTYCALVPDFSYPGTTTGSISIDSSGNVHAYVQSHDVVYKGNCTFFIN